MEASQPYRARRHDEGHWPRGKSAHPSFTNLAGKGAEGQRPPYCHHRLDRVHVVVHAQTSNLKTRCLSYPTSGWLFLATSLLCSGVTLLPPGSAALLPARSSECDGGVTCSPELDGGRQG